MYDNDDDDDDEILDSDDILDDEEEADDDIEDEESYSIENGTRRFSGCLYRYYYTVTDIETDAELYNGYVVAPDEDSAKKLIEDKYDLPDNAVIVIWDIQDVEDAERLDDVM